MDIYTYYQEQYDNTLALRDTMLSSGYNATVVLTLNIILNRFKVVLNEYSISQSELDDIATAPQYFGNNRLQLEEQMRNLEQLNSQLKSIIKGIDDLKIDQLQKGSMNSIFTEEDKTRVINNSINAFPECSTLDSPTVNNNLFIINDNDLEDYSVRFVNFLKLAEETYSELTSNGSSGKYIESISNIYSLITNTYPILDIIDRAITDKNYYNTNLDNVSQTSSEYDEFEIFYVEHIELVNLISEIYDTNTSKFDRIISNIYN